MKTEEERKKLKDIHLERLEKIAQTRAQSLIEEIKEAFGNLAYPGDENLIASAEHRAECEEWQKLFDFFVGKRWENCLNKKSYRKLDAGQSFFKPLAWRYYLPAFLIQNINRENFSSFYFTPEKNLIL